MLLIIPKVFNISCTINIGRWHILIIDSAISADEAGRSSVADLMSKRPMTAVDAIKKCIHNGMETTIRHGLSIEMEQSIRCLDTDDTMNAMQAYIRYLDQHINAMDPQKMTTEEINQVVAKLKALEQELADHYENN